MPQPADKPEKRHGETIMAILELDCSEVSLENQQLLAGFQDSNLRKIESLFPVKIYMRNGTIKLEGENQRLLDQVFSVLESMLKIIDDEQEMSVEETGRLCMIARKGYNPAAQLEDIEPVVRTKAGRLIYPKTAGQKALVQAFRSSDIVFASGPAGTGKTYLAVAYAVDQLKKEKISRIILTRPAVEAGESLGFLPGDMKEKVDPYLRPIYDALNEMLGSETVEKLQEKGVIEIAPLAFMRGRTLNEAAVILDEAQNATRAQMKMFLTRMGRRCQMMINGDVTQIDLIRKKDSGLMHAMEILEGVDGISLQHLDGRDVVRNLLVQAIIERYEQNEQ